MDGDNARSLDSIFERVAEICAEHLGVRRSRIKPGTRLVEDLNCDSLDLVDLMMAVEEEFGVSLPEPTDAEPVYKAVFTRSEFCIRDFAELVYVRERVEAGAAVSERWLDAQVPGRAASVPFTQLTGTADQNGNARALDEIGCGESGHRLFRRRIDGVRCVLVPGGRCEVGCDTGETDESPAHTIELSPFLIDVEPISVAAYSRFLNSVGVTDAVTLADWFQLSDDDHRRDHLPLVQADGVWGPRDGTARWPMMLVSWYGANAYSLWANGMDHADYKAVHYSGGRCSTLPSEAQWEYAARGSVYRDYPWGDQAPTPELARFGCHARGRTYELGDLPICDVNVALGVSPFGAYHMAGNVWQWCADAYDPRFYDSASARTRDPVNDDLGEVRVERGGSWIGVGRLLRSSYRRGRSAAARGRCLGFRCVGAAP